MSTVKIMYSVTSTINKSLVLISGFRHSERTEESYARRVYVDTIKITR